jgi:hypothetical protein
MTKRDEDIKGAKARKFLARSAKDMNWRLWDMAQRNPNDPELYFGRLLMVALLGLLDEEVGAEASASIKRGKEFAQSRTGAEARKKQGRTDEIKTAYHSFIHRPPHMRAALVADRLGLSVRYVRKVISHKKSELG